MMQHQLQQTNAYAGHWLTSVGPSVTNAKYCCNFSFGNLLIIMLCELSGDNG
jgi:hypothetical protein